MFFFPLSRRSRKENRWGCTGWMQSKRTFWWAASFGFYILSRTVNWCFGTQKFSFHWSVGLFKYVFHLSRQRLLHTHWKSEAVQNFLCSICPDPKKKFYAQNRVSWLCFDFRFHLSCDWGLHNHSNLTIKAGSPWKWHISSLNEWTWPRFFFPTVLLWLHFVNCTVRLSALVNPFITSMLLPVHPGKRRVLRFSDSAQR